MILYYVVLAVRAGVARIVYQSRERPALDLSYDP